MDAEDLPGAALTGAALARFFDHTLLRPEATPAEIERLCEEARRYGFSTVCVNPAFVPLCVGLLHGSDVKTCTVVGFPLGASTVASKVRDTEEAVGSGAGEIDMVINIGLLRSGDDAAVGAEIRHVVAAARAGGALTKVIIETALLTDDQKVRACRLAQQAGAEFVKTSTGFSKAGATVHDVQLMRQTVGPSMGVKAAGGIRTRHDALAMIAAGATRIGASASVQIVTGET